MQERVKHELEALVLMLENKTKVNQTLRIYSSVYFSNATLTPDRLSEFLLIVDFVKPIFNSLAAKF